MHDGAVLIRGEKVLAAGVTLPLSENNEAYQLGTRHKAALGISEASDAVALVMSEERGTIGIAINGTLATKVSNKQLSDVVQAALLGSTTQEIENLLKMPKS